MPCGSGLNVTQLRTAVKKKQPNVAVSKLNKTQLLAFYEGRKSKAPTIPKLPKAVRDKAKTYKATPAKATPVKAPPIPAPLKAPPLPPLSKSMLISDANKKLVLLRAKNEKIKAHLASKKKSEDVKPAPKEESSGADKWLKAMLIRRYDGQSMVKPTDKEASKADSNMIPESKNLAKIISTLKDDMASLQRKMDANYNLYSWRSREGPKGSREGAIAKSENIREISQVRNTMKGKFRKIEQLFLKMKDKEVYFEAYQDMIGKELRRKYLEFDHKLVDWVNK